MRLLIIRHGDPDYVRDTLTETGWKEAALLAGRMAKEDISDFYVSPLGRAKDTASLTLQKMNRTAVEYEWLREFAPKVYRPDAPDKEHVAWDWLPEDWLSEEKFFTMESWADHPVFHKSCSPGTGQSGILSEYDWVVSNFDTLLASHGYVRDGKMYRAERPNRDTLAFFCHFGLECVLLSHFMNVSPMILWHHMCAAPASVTTVYTEERRPGKAVFRISSFGDISHLYAAGEKPSFSARFCETFGYEGERHQ